MTSQNILRNNVQSLTRRHDAFHSDHEWMGYVYRTFDINTVNHVGYIMKFQVNDMCIFTIIQFGELMTAEIATSACGMMVGEELRDVYKGTSTLEDALTHWEDTSITPRLCISDHFNEEGSIILRWSETRTIYTTYRKLEDKIGWIAELESVNYAPYLFTFLQQAHDSENVQTRSHVSLAQHLNALFHCNSEGLGYVLGKADEGLEIGRTAIRKLDETNKKLGYINEETFRHRLKEEEGFPWASNFKFDTLAELVEWIGVKLNRRYEERQRALGMIVRSCLGDFQGHKGLETELETTDWHDVTQPLSDLFLL